MGLVRRAVNADDLLSLAEGLGWGWEGSGCQVMDESHICFIHCRAASCYNNSGAGEKMRGSLPREAGRRVREMLTTPRAHSRYRFRSHWPGSGSRADGLEVLTGNLLPVISRPAARQLGPSKEFFHLLLLLLFFFRHVARLYLTTSLFNTFHFTNCFSFLKKSALATILV